MRLLTFDIGLRIGYSFIESDKIPISGSYPVEGSVEELGKAGRALDGIVRNLILKFRPTHIGYAEPWPSKEIDTHRIHRGFEMVIEMIADELHIQSLETNETEARFAFMGFIPRGRKKIKRAIEAQNRARGWQVKDDDAADANCVGAHIFSIHDPDEAVRLMPLFQGIKTKKKKRK